MELRSARLDCDMRSTGSEVLGLSGDRAHQEQLPLTLGVSCIQCSGIPGAGADTLSFCSS